MPNHGNIPLFFAFRYEQWLQFFRAHWQWATCLRSAAVGIHLLHKFGIEPNRYEHNVHHTQALKQNRIVAAFQHLGFDHGHSPCG